MGVWVYGMKFLLAYTQPAKFGSYTHYDSGYIVILVRPLILHNHVIICDFMGKSLSS